MTDRRQQLVLALIAAGAASCVAALLPAHWFLFVPFFGSLHPLFVTAVAAVVGALSAHVLRKPAGFAVLDGTNTWRGIGWAVLVATGFAAVAIATDRFLVRYPRNMNVPLPQAWLFYPAMGYMVEVFFHLAPLAVLWTGLRPLRPRLEESAYVGLCLGLTAVIEPTFQVVLEPHPRLFTWLHVFGFNVAQVVLFRRHDFLTMATTRLVYYTYWHILWGTVRLTLLF
jgi:hypothetical protein